MAPTAQTSLHLTLARAFNPNELAALCFALGVNPDSVPHRESGVEVWAMEIVAFFDRRGGLAELIQRCRTERPNEPWQELLDAYVQASEAAARAEPGRDGGPAASFRTLSDILQSVPNAREVVIEAKVVFVRARRQIRRMSEFKDTHDLLQQLELAYRVVYDAIYENGDLLPVEKLRWRSLSTNVGALQMVNMKVCITVEAASFAADAMDWLGDLKLARGEFQMALDLKDVGGLDAGLNTIYGVLSSQPSRINVQLISAVDALMLPDLVRTLATVRDGLSRLALSSDVLNSDRVSMFSQDLVTLEARSSQLTVLRREHDQLQQFSDELRTEQDNLGRDGNINRFKLRWTKLGRKLRDWYGASIGDWAADLDAQVAKLEQSLGESGPLEVADALYALRSRLIERFNQVDHTLRSLCGELNEAGGPIDAIVERLA